MIEIIPALLPKHTRDIEYKVRLVKEGAKVIQLDICDGAYTPKPTWPFIDTAWGLKEILSQEEGMPYWKDVDYELDCMIKNPEEKMDVLLAMGPKRIIFHLNALTDPLSFLQSIDPYVKETIEIGLAVQSDVDIESLRDLVPHISFIQCMGVKHIGAQGQTFDDAIVQTISTLKKVFPETLVSVDGSVNDETVEALVSAGVDRVVIGSAIFNDPFPLGRIDHFKNIVRSVIR